MSTTNEAIGARVRRALGDRSQAWFAQRIGMTTDAVSRAINGKRGFSSVELAAAADVLGVDVYVLITGHEDPYRPRIAARHAFDPETGRRSVDGRETDTEVLDIVTLAYQQAYPDPAAKVGAPLDADAASMRSRLGEGFVRDFADRLEQRCDIDVIRVQDLTTAYSMTVAGHRVIVLPTNANWWRSNFSLAHEVAHLGLGHHGVITDDDQSQFEAAANDFAAELLLPEAMLRDRDWLLISGRDVAQVLWDTGVGTQALFNRLSSLGLTLGSQAQEMLARPMPGAMREHQRHMNLPSVPGESTSFFASAADPFDARMAEASRRRFPLGLITAHRRRIEDDGLNPATLAWMLQSPVEDLMDSSVFDRPAVDLGALFA